MNMKEKCQFLENLGFAIQHEDSSVMMVGIEFDFSATLYEPWAIIQAAVKEAYSQGLEDGEKKVKKGIKEILDIS